MKLEALDPKTLEKLPQVREAMGVLVEFAKVRGYDFREQTKLIAFLDGFFCGLGFHEGGKK